jgi:SAM-dependent methyltransferase
VHDAIPAGASILELGCGAGRVTHPLVALGHPVTAVDESPDAGPCTRGRDRVRAFLAACLRHVADDGSVIIQQQAPGWFAIAADAERRTEDGIIVRVRDVSRPGRDLVSATMEYVDGDRIWTHSFTARRLDDAAMAEALEGSGLRLDRYLTEDRSWLRAVPA